MTGRRVARGRVTRGSGALGQSVLGCGLSEKRRSCRDVSLARYAYSLKHGKAQSFSGTETKWRFLNLLGSVHDDVGGLPDALLVDGRDRSQVGGALAQVLDEQV